MTFEPLYILAILGGAGGVIAFLFRLLISSKDRETALLLAEKDRAYKEVEDLKKSYKEIAIEALQSAQETTAYYRAKEGKPPILPVAPIISESHSPSTQKQRETAEVATMRAKIAQIKMEEGQEPRKEPEHADESITPNKEINEQAKIIKDMAGDIQKKTEKNKI